VRITLGLGLAIALVAAVFGTPSRAQFIFRLPQTCGASGTVREVGSGQTFTTVQAGITAASAGETVRVHAGTYTEQITLKSGTIGSRLTICNATGETVTVQNGSFPVVTVNGSDYVTVDGINVTYTGTGLHPRGIENANGTNSDGVTLKNFTITMQGGTGLDDGACGYIYDSDAWTVDSVTCNISKASGSNEGIDGWDFIFTSHLAFTNNTIFGNAAAATGKLEDGIVVTGTDITISGNYIHDGWAFDTHPDGIVVQGDGDRAGNATARITIKQNHIAAFDQGVYLDCFNAACTGLDVWNNWIEERSYTYNGAAGMNCLVIDGESLKPTMTGTIYNNTLNCINLLNMRILDQGASSSWTVRNNLFMHPFFTSIEIDTTATSKVSMNFDFMDTNGDSTPVRWGASTFSWSGFKTACSCEANSVNNTFTLNSDGTEPGGAASIDAGTSLAGSFTVDRLGVTRPVGGGWDIGAAER
jgi:hypothetical protein